MRSLSDYDENHVKRRVPLAARGKDPEAVEIRTSVEEVMPAALAKLVSSSHCVTIDKDEDTT